MRPRTTRNEKHDETYDAADDDEGTVPSRTGRPPMRMPTAHPCMSSKVVSSSEYMSVIMGPMPRSNAAHTAALGSLQDWQRMPLMPQSTGGGQRSSSSNPYSISLNERGEELGDDDGRLERSLDVKDNTDDAVGGRAGDEVTGGKFAGDDGATGRAMNRGVAGAREAVGEVGNADEKMVPLLRGHCRGREGTTRGEIEGGGGRKGRNDRGLTEGQDGGGRGAQDVVANDGRGLDEAFGKLEGWAAGLVMLLAEGSPRLLDAARTAPTSHRSSDRARKADDLLISTKPDDKSIEKKNLRAVEDSSAAMTKANEVEAAVGVRVDGNYFEVGLFLQKEVEVGGQAQKTMSRSNMNEVGELDSDILENLSIAPASTPPPPPPSRADQTNAEAIERSWASVGGAATNTCEMGPGIRHDVLEDPRDIMAARMDTLKHRLHLLHQLDTTVDNTVDPLEELQSTRTSYSSDAASAGDSEYSSLSEEDRAELKTLGPADRTEFMSLSDTDRAEYYKNKRDIAAARHAWGTVMSAMRTFRALRPNEDLKEQLEEILNTLERVRAETIREEID
ncbi:hypothetical protein R3P38DRAFT_2788193 [Favolaschia claudopus]|uniref:Fibrous sheath-interacting protein 1 n=1 Tax=Favolaschia claudopus TaxID=2862362 RepID=A0AAW0ALH6_9AGAR